MMLPETETSSVLSVMRTENCHILSSVPSVQCSVKKVQLGSSALALLLLSNHLARSRSVTTMSCRAQTQTLAILRLDRADRAVFRVAGES